MSSEDADDAEIGLIGNLTRLRLSNYRLSSLTLLRGRSRLGELGVYDSQGELSVIETLGRLLKSKASNVDEGRVLMGVAIGRLGVRGDDFVLEQSSQSSPIS
jgi:hypothetical protein